MVLKAIIMPIKNRLCDDRKNDMMKLDVQVFMIQVCIFCLLFLISYAKLPISHDLEGYCDYFILPK